MKTTFDSTWKSKMLITHLVSNVNPINATYQHKLYMAVIITILGKLIFYMYMYLVNLEVDI